MSETPLEVWITSSDSVHKTSQLAGYDGYDYVPFIAKQKQKKGLVSSHSRLEMYNILLLHWNCTSKYKPVSIPITEWLGTVLQFHVCAARFLPQISIAGQIPFLPDYSPVIKHGLLEHPPLISIYSEFSYDFFPAVFDDFHAVSAA